MPRGQHAYPLAWGRISFSLFAWVCSSRQTEYRRSPRAESRERAWRSLFQLEMTARPGTPNVVSGSSTMAIFTAAAICQFTSITCVDREALHPHPAGSAQIASGTGSGRRRASIYSRKSLTTGQGRAKNLMLSAFPPASSVTRTAI
jgi:hypothetical protein